jgi:hypothetical protein
MNLKRNWRIFLTMLMVGLVAFGTTLTGFNASTVPGVPSGNGVFPYVEPVNDPNVYCDTEGEILATKVKLNQDTPGEYSLLEGKITATIYEDDGYTGLNFTSEIPISYVYVKGGPEGGNMYLYDPPSFGDTGLYTPVNPSNNTPSGISHVTFYYCEPQYGCLTLTKDFLGVPEGYILPAVTGSILGQYGDTYNFTLDETNGYSQTLCGLYPGQYTVTEDPILGFTTTYPNGNTAMVVPGGVDDAVLVAIENQLDTGCLTITKDFLGVPEGYILPTVTGSILGQYGDTYNFTLDETNGYSQTLCGLYPGQYTVTEDPILGFTTTYPNGNTAMVVPGGVDNAVLVAIENQLDTGCLILTKDFLGVPEGYILPTVTGSILGQYGDTYNFTLDETNGYSQTLCGLYPGQYTVTEDPILGFTTTYPNGNTAMVVAGDMADAVVINIRNIYEVAQRPSIEVSNVTITNADKFNGTASGTFDITNMSGGDSTWVTLGEVSVSFVARGRGGIRGVFSAIYTLSPVDATGYTLSPKETMTFTYECTQMDWVSGNLINLEDARELTAVVNVAGAWNQLGEFRDRIWTDTSSPYPLD